MKSKLTLTFETGILLLALAALPLWCGCAKEKKSAEPAAPAADAEKPTAVDAYKADMQQNADSPEEQAAETSDAADDTFPGADGNVKVLAAGQSFDKAIASAKIVVVDFKATWCGPCRKLGPYLERMAESYKSDGVSFFSVDVDEHGELAQQLDIPSIPDVRIYVDGNPVDKIVGCEPMELMGKIDVAVKNASN